MAEGIWNLCDHVQKLDSASESWAKASRALKEAADGLNSKSRSVRDAGWEGATATSYDTHRKDVVGSLDDASALASGIASTLSTAAGSVRVAQGHLDQEWAKVLGIPHTGSPSGDVRFETTDQAEADEVNGAYQAAVGIRADLDKALAKDTTGLTEAKGKWDAIASKWYAVANGSDAFTLPVDTDGVGVITDGNRTTINTGAGDDYVQVFVDPRTGEQIVMVNGQAYRFPAGQQIVIRGGGGNDVIQVSTAPHVTVLGGEGDDRIQGGSGSDTILGLDGDDEVKGGSGDDRISGGEGRDYVDGQTGNDTLSGGTGDDTVYGLDGTDELSGGDGQDYLEGGKGDDTLLGNDGNDILSGGRDNDTILGGSGDDVSYAGLGHDTTYGGTGADTSYSEAGDGNAGTETNVTVEIPDTARFINIEGSPEFVARVEADLDMLRSSPSGQQMLANMQYNHDHSGFLGVGQEELTIREYHSDTDPNNSKAHDGPMGGNVIEYNPQLDTIAGAPPVAVLYHEMAHVYDYMNGTLADGDYHGTDTQNDGVHNREREAVGLPIDHDNNPNTPEQLDPDHPYVFTENGLRHEMGAPNRDHY